MIFEVRNYHVDPAVFPAFRRWAQDEGVPYLKSQLDVVGFWYATDERRTTKACVLSSGVAAYRRATTG